MAVKLQYSTIIDAPYDLVWEVTNDVARWTDLFPGHASVDVIHHEGDTVRFRITKHPDEQGRVMTWVSDRTMYRDEGEARAVRVETGPFEYMHLRWVYEDLPEGVRLTWHYEFTAKADAPYDDTWMKAHFDESVPRELEGVRNTLEARAQAALADEPVH
ncbi:SRPBCC family protein [Nocardiopsis sp. SBT366]|uniref:SRPBCC family protein n=1 Tax=Nocardiopsis sp. SBT366 TaxID=1580529 RepID=UPI00066B16C0|nr:SRPBCC family protein [Nocardiopsis sp. SBT366]